MELDVYCYGMTVLSSIHRLTAGDFAAGGYGEIGESFVCPGGEAMNAAILLSGLGFRCAVGGPHLGHETSAPLRRYAARYGIDVSGLREDPSYAGVRDLVVIHGLERSVLGWFGGYFSQAEKRWSEPDATCIAAARVVALDPFFGASSELCAELCRRFDKPYVTLDCPPDSALHRHAAANVVSREYRNQQFSGVPEAELFARYLSASAALTIFTSGQGAIRYGRRGGPLETLEPFKVNVKSTLGAGDAFRAGVVYGLFEGLSDGGIVHTAAGLAALACTRLPIADHAATRSELARFSDPASA